MYEAFYGLKKKPFSMLPDPDFLFLSKKHQAALTLLEYGMLNHAGFCVISGEPGAGKTTIIRALLQNVGNDVSVGLITNTHRSFGGLLDWILSAFNLHQPNMTQVEMHQAFMDFVINEYANNRSVLLVVDEAQNMTADTLEELRMLSNVNSEKDLLMQIILAGQPELKEMLSSPELMQFAQRIAVDYHLDSLNLEETCGYIQHRLRVAGAQRDVFTPAACERIHNYSGGTPRLINLLCETVMVYGFADQLKMIDVDLVEEMVQERMKDSIVPLVNRNNAKQSNKAASMQLERDFPWISPDKSAQGVAPQVTAAPEEVQQFNDDPDRRVVDNVNEPPSQVDSIQSEAEEIYSFENNIEEIATSADDDVAQVEINKIEISETVSYQRPENFQSPENELPTVTENMDASDDEDAEEKSEFRKSLLKYGVISALLGVILVAAAVVIEYGNKLKSADVNSQLFELPKQKTPKKEELLIEAEANAEAAKAEAAAAAQAETDRARAAAEAEAAKIRAAAEAEAAKARAAAEAEIAKVKAEAARAKAAAESAKAKAIAEAQAAAKAKAAAVAARAKATAEAEATAKVKAELLKQQQSAALAKQDEAKRLKEEAEKLAAQKRALAAEAAKKKRLAEQQRIAKAKEKQRKQKTAAAKAAELENERLFKQAQLERQKRLEHQQEARRLELEWLEQQRQELREAEAAQMLRLSEEAKNAE
ncbi:MAG: AAA family ATPase [Gammaproteobacteria bacterium]|jgi:type II secretory pathway predicted ATPase ExeA|nr:AAA family ATPase [Gammaproteobacteria bacterium]